MKVQLSTTARTYIRNEARYLKARSRAGAEGFRQVVQRAQRLVADFPEGGLTTSAITLTGARRIVIDGYLFDYDLIGDVVWIQNVRSSVAIRTIAVEDDSDYEDD